MAKKKTVEINNTLASDLEDLTGRLWCECDSLKDLKKFWSKEKESGYSEMDDSVSEAISLIDKAIDLLEGGLNHG